MALEEDMQKALLTFEARRLAMLLLRDLRDGYGLQMAAAVATELVALAEDDLAEERSS